MKKFLLLILTLSYGALAQTENQFLFNQQKFELQKNVINNDDSFEWQYQSSDQKRKSVGIAFLMSLVVPGLGEYYLNKPAYTKIFLSLEGIVWGGLLTNQLRINWMEKEYKTFARQHAGVASGSKDDLYWLRIGKFDDIYEHNEERRRDRLIDQIYPENAINYWRWNSRQNRLKYDTMRIDAKQRENYNVYFYSALLLNHFASAINSLRLAKKHNKRIDQNDWNLGFTHDINQNNISVIIVKSF